MDRTGNNDDSQPTVNSNACNVVHESKPTSMPTHYTTNKSLPKTDQSMIRSSKTAYSVPTQPYPHSNYFHNQWFNPPIFYNQHSYGTHHQAELTAFTPSLMSIRFPSQMIRSNYYYQPQPKRQYETYRHSFTPKPTKEAKVAAQPQYYVDTFLPNFSDKSTSKTNAKMQSKHVSFQDSEKVNESVNTNLNETVCLPPSSNDVNKTNVLVSSRKPLEPTSAPFYPSKYTEQYCSYDESYPIYDQSILSSNSVSYPNMTANSSWMPYSPYFSQYPSDFHQSSCRKQLYDPNKPRKVSQNISNEPWQINHKTPTKAARNTKENVTINSSDTSTSKTISQHITILRKPDSSKESNSSAITNIVLPVENRPNVSSEIVAKETFISSSESNSNVSGKNDDDSNNIIKEKIEEVKDDQVLSINETITNVSSSTDNHNLATEETEKITNDQTLSLPIHEILSLLQSANCILALNDYAQQKKIKLNSEFQSDSSTSFICIISINGRRFPPSPCCSSKNEAQKKAYNQLLNILYNESALNANSSIEFSTKYDYLAHQSMNKFQNLNIYDLLSDRKTMACILMVNNQQYDQAQVVSVGTGDRCLNDCSFTLENDGTLLHDCHAEILARRGFIRFLFEQIKQSRQNSSSIVQYNSTINKYELERNITFHMYISSVPCGYTTLNNVLKPMRYKQGQTEGTLLASTSTTKYPIKSCSDKIYRWTIFGIQGGLLINLISTPIYLETITLASETSLDLKDVKYSLCEHLNKHLTSLPEPFSIHTPDIDYPTIKSFKKERQVAKLQTSAFAWNAIRNDEKEILEPSTGRLKTSRSSSVLCKRNIFEDFVNFIRTNHPNDPTLSFKTYQEAKQLNKAYVKVKELISKAYQMASSNDSLLWLSKNDQVEQFSIE